MCAVLRTGWRRRACTCVAIHKHTKQYELEAWQQQQRHTHAVVGLSYDKLA